MAGYELVFKKSVTKDLRSVPKTDLARILKRIEALREEPRGVGCVKLSAQERYRVRQGGYRIVYEIREIELVVMVVKVGHRSAVSGQRSAVSGQRSAVSGVQKQLTSRFG